MKTKNYILLIFLVFISNSVFSQVKEKEILSRNQIGQPKFIKLNETKITFDKKSTDDFLKKQFSLNENVTFKNTNETSFNQIQTKKLQQYYKGIKIEFGQITVSAKNNQIKTITGNVLNIKELNINPSLSEQNALGYALQKVNAIKYAWENQAMENLLKEETEENNATYYPIGKLVILDKNLYDDIQEPVLAYKFDIYSINPISRANYYVDANNGEILLVDAILKHVEGTAATRYSGNRTIETELNSGNFRLRDYTRGNGILTYNANHAFFDANGSLNLNGATDFTDNNNNWTATEFNNANRDNAALDAHWGAEMTYDYFLQNHNRNSIDGSGYQLRNYVHVGTNWGNAAWDGQRMLYGDGNFTFNALTSIDVIGHEIGHGLDQNTSNLLYERESGAIDEGLSDIWGAMVEFSAAPEKDTYLVGEEIMLNANNLRSMSNPNASFVAQPDTYGGNFWQDPNCNNPNPNQNDNCGVHTNSGIMNYWFFLLAEGGSGVNDNGDSYNVAGIGKTKAAKIVYRAQTIYFNSLTTYHDARDLTVNASQDLYGKDSVEEYNVANAWYAVGIGTLPQTVTHYIQGPTQLTPGYRATYSMNPYENATNYVWTIPSGCYYNYCWNINYGQGTKRISIAAGNIGVHEITCVIYNGNTIIGSQYLIVNVQNPPSGGGSGGDDPCGGIDPIDGVIYPPVECDPNALVAQKTYFKQIVVYDFTGKSVLKTQNSDYLDINHLASGIYIIKAELSNGEILTKKIMK